MSYFKTKEERALFLLGEFCFPEKGIVLMVINPGKAGEAVNQIMVSNLGDERAMWQVVSEAAKAIAKRIGLNDATTGLPDIEEVSAKVHEEWMENKKKNGYFTRLSENGEELMVPYDQLSEEAKQLDRGTVMAVYRAIQASPIKEPAPETAE